VKGPPALVFFGAFAAGIASVRGRGWLVSRPFLLVLGLGLALASTWIFLLASHPGVPDVWAIWSHEVGGDRGGIGGWLANLLELLVGVPVMFFPGALVVLGAWRSDVGARVFEEQPVRALCVCIALAFAVFFVWPGSRPRYLFPLAPLVALVAGRIVDESLLAGAAGAFAKRIRMALAVLGGLGVLAPLAALVLYFRPIGPLERISPLGMSCALAACVAGLVLLRRLRRGPSVALLACGVAVMCALRLIERLELVPAVAIEHGHLADARALSQALPPEAILHTALWAEFNLLFYVDRPVRYAEDPNGLGPEEFVLVAAGSELPGERVLARTLGQGRAVEIVKTR
jgi:4-amino-4-deoxy-L-arabinose transferase-like glycosyltransferase